MRVGAVALEAFLSPCWCPRLRRQHLSWCAVSPSPLSPLPSRESTPVTFDPPSHLSFNLQPPLPQQQAHQASRTQARPKESRNVAAPNIGRGRLVAAWCAVICGHRQGRGPAWSWRANAIWGAGVRLSKTPAAVTTARLRDPDKQRSRSGGWWCSTPLFGHLVLVRIPSSARLAGSSGVFFLSFLGMLFQSRWRLRLLGRLRMRPDRQSLPITAGSQ